MSEPKRTVKEKPPTEFEPIETREEAARLLREGAKIQASTMLWTRNQTRTLQTHLTAFNQEDRYLMVWIPKGEDPEALATHLIETGEKECYFSVSLTGANIFFRAGYQHVDGRDYKFKLPEQLFKVQRRQNMRMPLMGSQMLKVEIQDPLFPENKIIKKAIDISSSGLSFLATDDEATIFQAGIVLKEVVFTIRGVKIKVEAEVKHARKFVQNQVEQGFKVGIEFRGIKNDQSRHITAYVIEESRKYYSRFLG